MSGWHIIRVMQQKPRSHKDLIDALGGPSGLARHLDIYKSVPTTVHWPTRGIPSKYWHKVVRLADAKGIAITADDLETMPVQASAKASS